jgi:signal transduction histidine kinase
MATIWAISENPVLADTLEIHLRSLGEVRTGPPQRSHWREAPAPDLLVVAATDAPGADFAGLERILGFIRSLPSHRRAPVPVLYVEPPAGHPSAALARALIDDRPVAGAAWPPEPPEILALSGRLLDASLRPPGLRERARREWVAKRVELFYADFDLPSLRHAIDPRNAARPVLLAGELGTGKGLLAHYIHNLAEPPREELVLLSAETLEVGRVESCILDACTGKRVTVYLSGLDRAERAVQEQVADLLGQSGVLAIEAIRWIAGMTQTRQVPEVLRSLPWIRVNLRPLRDRPDLEKLAQALTEEAARRAFVETTLSADALAALRGVAWLGNLRELEDVINDCVVSARGPVIEATDLFVPAPLPAAPVVEPSPPAADTKPEEVAGPEREPTDIEPPTQPAAEAVASETSCPEAEPVLAELVGPLAQEIRQPMLAIRTCASLLDQRPTDEKLRHDLTALMEGELPLLEELLGRLERFSQFGAPKTAAQELAPLIASELEALQPAMRQRSLVVLRELQTDSPPVSVDEDQLRFALRGLLNRALRIVPAGGDLYIGSHHHPASGGREARHRLLIRFHSPEEVLVAPDDTQGPRIALEVIMARALILRMGGSFAADSSGAQDNVIVIELPGAPRIS